MTKKPTPKATKPAKATKPVNKSRSTTQKKAAPKVVSKPKATAPKPVRAIEPSPAPIIIEEFIPVPGKSYEGYITTGPSVNDPTGLVWKKNDPSPFDSALRTHDAWRGYTNEDKSRFDTNQQWNAAIQDTQATPPAESEPRSRKVLYAIGAIVAGLAIWWGVSLL